MERVASEEGGREGPTAPVFLGGAGHLHVARRNEESVPRARDRVEVACALPARNLADRDLQEMGELVRDRVREGGIRGPRGPQADPWRVPVVVRDAEEPGRRREEVELEVERVQLGESREEGVDEVRERGRVAVRGEPRTEPDHDCDNAPRLL
jgi:hypothetical protein